MKPQIRTATLAAAFLLIGVGAANAQEEAKPAEKGAVNGAPFSVDEARAKAGKSLYSARGCSGCHTIGKGRSAGPDLAHLLERRDLDWVVRWLGNTTEMLATDPIGQQMLKDHNNTKMPDFKMKPEDAEALAHYITQQSAKVKKQ